MEENLPKPNESATAKPLRILRILKIVAVCLILLYVLISLAYSYAYNYVNNYPETNPDKTLEIETRVATFFEKITLPIKIARLSAEEADKELLMPVYGHRISEIADTWQAPEMMDGCTKARIYLLLEALLFFQLPKVTS